MPTSNTKPIGLKQAEAYLLKHWQTYWPYSPGGDASLESTSWCAIALRSNTKIAEETWQYFKKTQLANGGWSTGINDQESDWTSNLVVLALRILAEQMELDTEKQAFLRSGYHYLINSRRQAYIEFLRWIFWLLKLPSNFPAGRGWPFIPGTVMLVEPTAYALMAIKPTKLVGDDTAKSVIPLAEEYIFSRYCKRGGWNYGENVRLTEQLPAYAVTTAQTVIALQDKKDDERVKTGLNFLTQTARENNTCMSLAWSALARDCLGQDTKEELQMLKKHQNSDGSFGGSVYLTAIACCALQIEEENPLKFPQPTKLEIRLSNK